MPAGSGEVVSAQVNQPAWCTRCCFLRFVHKPIEAAYHEKIINTRINAGYSTFMAKKWNVS
jgi:hypothetical protein